MPEAVVASRVMNRIEDEILNVDETFLEVLFSADIVKAINEIMNFVERDDYDWALGPAIDEVVNFVEYTTRTVLSVGDFLVKVVNETVNVAEEVYSKLQFVVDIPIVQVISEVFIIYYDSDFLGIRPEVVKAMNLVRVRTEAFFVSEATITVLEEIVVKVIDEVLNTSETSVEIVIATALELVKVINETVRSVDSAVFSVLYILGIVRVVDEGIDIDEYGYEGKFELMTPILFIIGQLAGMFRVLPRLRGIFRINQDVEQ